MTTLILCCDVAYKKLEQGELPLTLFSGIAKAFDSISHNIVLYKLAKVGFDHDFLQFFASYLTNRKQIVFLCKTLSHSHNITSGGPQGPIFAVVLFSLYINDMPVTFDNPSFLYADNTEVFGNWFDLSSIQTDLNNAITWAAENRIDFSCDQLTFEQLRFQKLNKRYSSSDLLSIDGEQIVLKDTV